MARIQVMGLSFHAFHGCHPHEQRTGGVFEVDMIVDGDFSAAQNSDDVDDAVDYVRLMEIAQEQMNVRCNLIEKVAQNIANAVSSEYVKTNRVEIIVRKMAPPLSFQLQHVSVNYVIENG
ncbi:MAG: dihydroneopterin aldolase [Flavobacteriales bacterium]|nr:dihydroneopterin aldolase [Flavobacteriales bacterium]